MELSTCHNTSCSNYKLCLSDTNCLWNYALFMIIGIFNFRLDKCQYQNTLIFSKLFHSSLDFISYFFIGTNLAHLLQETVMDEFISEVSKLRLRSHAVHSTALWALVFGAVLSSTCPSSPKYYLFCLPNPSSGGTWE